MLMHYLQQELFQQFQLYFEETRMKFSKSYRSLHEQQLYTPPCTHYQPDIHQNRVILTGSLAGPAFNYKHQTFFGQSKRFTKPQETVPGPGTYTLVKNFNSSKKKVIQNVQEKINVFKKFHINQNSSPSIPFSYYGDKMDEDDEIYVRELMMDEDLNKSITAVRKRQPSYSFEKSSKRIDLANKQQQPLKVNDQRILDRIIEIEEKQEFHKNNNKKWMEAVKKSTNRRNQLVLLMNPEFVPSLELIEIMSKRRTKYTPGPGQYQNSSSKQTANSQQEKGISFSSSQRFAIDKTQKIGPGSYSAIPEINNKKGVIFNRTDRKLFNMKEQTDIEHRFYIDPSSNFSDKRLSQNVRPQTHPFGSSIVRFQIEKKIQGQCYQNIKMKRKSQLLGQNIEKRLKVLHKKERVRSTQQSQGLLGIQTMASVIQ